MAKIFVDARKKFRITIDNQSWRLGKVKLDNYNVLNLPVPLIESRYLVYYDNGTWQSTSEVNVNDNVVGVIYQRVWDEEMFGVGVSNVLYLPTPVFLKLREFVDSVFRDVSFLRVSYSPHGVTQNIYEYHVGKSPFGNRNLTRSVLHPVLPDAYMKPFCSLLLEKGVLTSEDGYSTQLANKYYGSQCEDVIEQRFPTLFTFDDIKIQVLGEINRPLMRPSMPSETDPLTFNFGALRVLSPVIYVGGFSVHRVSTSKILRYITAFLNDLINI